MKNAGKTIVIVGAALNLLVALVYVVLEGRTLFSGDWSIYNNAFGALIRYFSRLVLALAALAYSLTAVMSIRKESASFMTSLCIIGLGMTAASAIILITATNHVGWLILIPNLILVLGCLIFRQGIRKENR